jgi:hypothetical protein
MRTQIFLTVAFVAMMTSAAAQADDNAKDEKFCEAITDFRSDVKTLDGIGSSSTLAELRAATERTHTDSQRVQKAAAKLKTPTAKEFGDAAKKLHRDARSLPDDITIAQAKAKLADDIQSVKQAGHQLSVEAGCPGTPATEKDTENSMDRDQAAPPSPRP